MTSRLLCLKKLLACEFCWTLRLARRKTCSRACPLTGNEIWRREQQPKIILCEDSSSGKILGSSKPTRTSGGRKIRSERLGIQPKVSASGSTEQLTRRETQRWDLARQQEQQRPGERAGEATEVESRLKPGMRTEQIQHGRSSVQEIEWESKTRPAPTTRSGKVRPEA
jgi:hypothetical protein